MGYAIVNDSYLAQVLYATYNVMAAPSHAVWVLKCKDFMRYARLYLR